MHKTLGAAKISALMRTRLSHLHRVQIVAGIIAGIAIASFSSHIGFGRTQENKLPDGAGRDIVTDRCLICHGAEPILQQRLPRDKWVGEVDKMIRWGAEVPADSKDKLVDYLARNFAYHPILPPKMPGTLPDGDGKEVLDQTCLSCHGAEPISQQRLSRSQWTAEVDKMIRWGADVPADQKTRLVDYLAKNFSNVR
jgi:mono/diheme cytochrome c family protein